MRDFDIARQELCKKEESINALIDQLQGKESTGSSSEYEKLVTNTCDNMKSGLLVLVRMHSDLMNNGAIETPRNPAKKDENLPAPPLDPCQSYKRDTKNHSSGRPGPSVNLKPAVFKEPQQPEEDFEILTLSEDDKQGAAIAAQAKTKAQPSPQTAQAWGAQGDGFRVQLVATLRRMTGRVQGFLDWLKDKVKAAASRAWEGVRKAFSSVLTFLKELGNKIASACRGNGVAGYSKVHMA